MSISKLLNMSPEAIELIRRRISIRPSIYPYIVKNEVLYFLRNTELHCVSLQKENEVYRFFFNGRFIKINCLTGKCFIVDSNRNCFEYFCIDDFFQTARQNTQYSLLYRLLIRERFDKYKRRSVHSVSIFFTPIEVVGQIERAGQSSLKSPLGCLSIHEMFKGIELFIDNRVSACFMRSSNLFRTAIWRNPMPSQTPSVDQIYGKRLFLNSKIKRRSFAMIYLIMQKFLRTNLMKGAFKNQVAKNFLARMIRSLSSMMSNEFLKFQKTDQLDKLINSCQAKISLKSDHTNSIDECVSDMIEKNHRRAGLIKQRRVDWFDEQHHHEQEEHQKKRAFQVFQEGLAGIEVDVSQARKGRCILDEFESGGDAMMKKEFDETETRKRGRELEAFEFEDDRSFLKFEKF